MDLEIIKKYSILSPYDVSRETCVDFENFISMIIEENTKTKLISRKIRENSEIRHRHIIDSAQIIDFIDLNTNTTCDLGSGGGMPGIVIAIMFKNIKKDMKIQLYEKSYNKSMFLKQVSKKLNLNTEVIQKDISEVKNIISGTIMSRAFKPLPDILDLVNKNFKDYKNIILFMGKTGKSVLNETLKKWDMEFSEKQSLTNPDSFLLNIKKMEKKILN